MALIYLLVSLITITSSFDVIGSIDLNGGNIKISILFFIACIGLLLPGTIKNRRLFQSKESYTLILWTVINIAFLFNSPEIFRSLSYSLWLLILVLYCLVIQSTFGNETLFKRLFIIYYISFFILSIFGILQFLLYKLGANIFVVQEFSGWARVSGLSYEPSYFATYLIAGWSMGIFCYFFNACIISRIIDIIMLIVISLCLLFTTSRIGICCMISALMIVILYNFLFTKTFSLKYLAKYSLIITLLTLSIFGISKLISGNDFSIVLEGTGLNDTAGGSVDTRMEGVNNYCDLFMKNPLIGYSIGGVAAAAAKNLGNNTLNMDVMREAQGTNVTLEIALATGLMGVLLFLHFINKITIYPLFATAINKKNNVFNYSIILSLASCFSVLIEFIALQFNQNILRNYFWVQIALALAGVKCISKSKIYN